MLPGAGCRYRSLPSSSACVAQRQEEWIWEDFSIHQNDGSWKLIFLWLVLWIELTELQFFLSHSSAHSHNTSALTQIITNSASKTSIRRFVIMEKAPSRAFSWLKAATTAFTFKTLLRHYAKRTLTPRSLNVKLGPRCKGHKGGLVSIVSYSHPNLRIAFVWSTIFRLHLRDVRAGTLVRGQAHAGRQGDRGVHQLHHLLQPEVHRHRWDRGVCQQLLQV